LKQDFEQYGIHLPPTEQAELNVLNDQLNYAQAVFNQNITKEKEPLVIPPNSLHKLPQQMVDSLPRDSSGRAVLPLDPATANSVLKMVGDPELRNSVYLATASVEENLPVLDALLQMRQDFAKRLNFDSFADFTHSRTMAASQTRVLEFLEEVSRQVRPQARIEAAEVHTDRQPSSVPTPTSTLT